MAEAWSSRSSTSRRTFFERGWTDGLPIVAPTPDRVQAMLDVVLADDPDTLIGYLPARGRGVTIEKAAINAVMAGCRPEYFPVVVAALEAMFDEAFNLHTVLTSTGGAALCAIVSGPIADEIGMNARHNVLGQGNRANATIGRALRLVAHERARLQARRVRRVLVRASRQVHALLRRGPAARAVASRCAIELGYFEEDTTVTMVPVEGPHQLAQQLTDSAARRPALVRDARSAIPTWFSTGKGGHGALVLGPEHAGFCIAEGWTQADVREYVYEQARIAADELRRGGRADRGERPARHAPGRRTARSPSLRSPDDVLLVTAGGEGAGWSAWLPAWAPTIHAYRATRRVRPAGEPLPECGPDGCIVPWMK